MLRRHCLCCTQAVTTAGDERDGVVAIVGDGAAGLAGVLASARLAAERIITELQPGASGARPFVRRHPHRRDAPLRQGRPDRDGRS